MGWAIDPYTGRRVFVPEGGPENLGYAIRGRSRAAAEDEARRAVLADLLERYSQQEAMTAAGTPWLAPGLERPVGVTPQMEPGTIVPEGMPNAPSRTSPLNMAMAQLGRLSQPGTPEYEDLAKQIGSIRAQSQFGLAGISPETYEAELGIAGEERLQRGSMFEYGVPGGPPGLRERAVAAAEMRARKTGQGRSKGPKKVTETLLTPEGLPATQDVFYDTEGNETRRGPVVPKGGGSAMVFDEESGRLVYSGPAEKVTEVTAARAQAKRVENLKDRRAGVLNMRRQLGRVKESVAKGVSQKAIIGQLGNLIGTGASYSRQLGVAGQVLGTNTINEFVTEALSNPQITATLATSGDLQNQELSLAYLRVLAEGNPNPGQREVMNAIERNKAIFGGDPVMRQAAIDSLDRTLVEGFNTAAQEAGQTDLVIPIAPQVQLPGFEPPPTLPAEPGWQRSPSGLEYRVVE